MSLEDLVQSLRSDDHAVRRPAIEALRGLGAAAEPAVPALLELFARDVGDDDICATIRALGAIPWGPHREDAAAVLCALAKFAIVHAGGLRAVSALRRWYPEGPDSVSYQTAGMPRFFDGHQIAIDLLGTLEAQQVVPDPVEVALQWLHPYGLDEGRPGRRWAARILRSAGLSGQDQQRVRSALATAERLAREKAEGALPPPQRWPGVPDRPTNARKPFVLDDMRIDFQPNAARTHHRVTVERDPVAMTYEEIRSGTTNSGSHGPRVRMAEQPMPWLVLKELLEAPAPWSCRSRRMAICAWRAPPADCQGTVIHSSDEVTLQFSEDWTAVKISWHSWGDTSA